MQEMSYPWIAALIKDQDKRDDMVDPHCSGTLVSLGFIQYKPTIAKIEEIPPESTKVDSS